MAHALGVCEKHGIKTEEDLIDMQGKDATGAGAGAGLGTVGFNPVTVVKIQRALAGQDPATRWGIARSVLGSWVGVRHLFHLSLFLTAPRMVLTQDPSTDAAVVVLASTSKS